MGKLHLLNNKSKKNNAKGFYIALGVCLIAVGVAAWTTYDSVVNYASPEDEGGASSSEVVKRTNEAVSGIKVFGDASEASKASSKPQVSLPPSSQSEKVVVSAKHKRAKKTNAIVQTFISPVDGKNVTQKYSGENPVYSKTMKDWRVHTGVDFSAKAGDTVKAVADGTVKKVYTDDCNGKTVVIMHGDLETYYCGLKEISVKKGEKVKQGQKIGTVGIVPFESSDTSHLHLAMKKNGKFIDPLSIIK